MPLQKQHAVDFIVETLMREPSGTVTLCALGPLTNIALALIREPEIAPRIKEIVLMGGGFFEGGNVTPTAEFNIYVDPHAADVVFKSGIPIVMMPLDVTHKALTTSQAHRRLPRARHQGRHRRRRDARILRALRRGEIRHRRRAAARPLRHRLSAEAGAVQGPRTATSAVETASELTMGMTVIDWWGVTKRPKNATVMRDIDHDGVLRAAGREAGEAVSSGSGEVRA